MQFRINPNNIAEFIDRTLTVKGKELTDTRFDKYLGLIEDAVIEINFANINRHPIFSKSYLNDLFNEYQASRLPNLVLKDNSIQKELASLECQMYLCSRVLDSSFNIDVNHRKVIDDTLDKRIKNIKDSKKPRDMLEYTILNIIKTEECADHFSVVNISTYGISGVNNIDVKNINTLYSLYGERDIVGFKIHTDKWFWSRVKDLTLKERNKNLSSVADFTRLFDSTVKTKKNNLDFEFINKNNKLVKRYLDGRPDAPYDIETVFKDHDNIVAKFCTDAKLGDNSDNTCTNLLKQCNSLDDGSKCATFMQTLSRHDFPKLMQELSHVDPLIINTVITAFKWETQFNTTLKVRELVPPNIWLTPKDTDPKSRKDSLKLLRENTNLIAFFDAIKATTDTFPAILNPGYTGSNPNNGTFNLNSQTTVLGKMGLKPLLHNDKLHLDQSLTSLLGFKSMINNHYGRMAVKFGLNLPGLTPLGSFMGFNMRGGLVGNAAVDNVVRTLKESTNNETYIHTASTLRKLWENILMKNLSDNYGMDVTNIKSSVGEYLNELEKLQEKTLYAIAYVKVFTDELEIRQASGQDLPKTINDKSILELTGARNKLVTRSYTKDMGLIEILEKLIQALKGK